MASTLSALQQLYSQLQQLTNKLTPAANVSSSLLDNNTSSLVDSVEAALVALQLEQLQQQAISQQVWDFYPTPPALTLKMLDLAQIKLGLKVLEPSAGLGHVCREIRNLGAEPDCFEISPLLRRGLRLQGFNLIGTDFLSSTPSAIYDRVVANPPFSNNGIARHTLRALDWLRPGGRLVTLAHHYQLQPSATDRAFFEWLKGFGAKFYNCGQAFAKAERPCNIPIQIIAIDKPCW